VVVDLHEGRPAFHIRGRATALRCGSAFDALDQVRSSVSPDRHVIPHPPDRLGGGRGGFRLRLSGTGLVDRSGGSSSSVKRVSPRFASIATAGSLRRRNVINATATQNIQSSVVVEDDLDGTDDGLLPADLAIPHLLGFSSGRSRTVVAAVVNG